MTFFSTPEVPWLYLGVAMTRPSNEAVLAAHLLGVLVLVLAERRRQQLIQVRQLIIAQIARRGMRVESLPPSSRQRLGDPFAPGARPQFRTD